MASKTGVTSISNATTKKVRTAHGREWIYRIPIAVIIVHDHRGGRDIGCPEFLHNVIDQNFKSRCAIRSCKMQMLLVRCNLVVIGKHTNNKARDRNGTHVLHMNDEEPLLVHTVEWLSHGVQSYGRCRHHGHNEHTLQQRSVSKPMREGQ